MYVCTHLSACVVCILYTSILSENTTTPFAGLGAARVLDYVSTTPFENQVFATTFRFFISLRLTFSVPVSPSGPLPVDGKHLKHTERYTPPDRVAKVRICKRAHPGLVANSSCSRKLLENHVNKREACENSVRNRSSAKSHEKCKFRFHFTAHNEFESTRFVPV